MDRLRGSLPPASFTTPPSIPLLAPLPTPSPPPPTKTIDVAPYPILASACLSANPLRSTRPSFSSLRPHDLCMGQRVELRLAAGDYVAGTSVGHANASTGAPPLSASDEAASPLEARAVFGPLTVTSAVDLSGDSGAVLRGRALGAAANYTSIFTVRSGAPLLTLRNLHFRHFSGAFAVAAVGGALAVDGCEFRDNPGGAIAVEEGGSASIASSSFIANGDGTRLGGAIYVKGTALWTQRASSRPARCRPITPRGGAVSLKTQRSSGRHGL